MGSCKCDGLGVHSPVFHFRCGPTVIARQVHDLLSQWAGKGAVRGAIPMIGFLALQQEDEWWDPFSHARTQPWKYSVAAS